MQTRTIETGDHSCQCCLRIDLCRENVLSDDVFSVCVSKKKKKKEEKRKKKKKRHALYRASRTMIQVT